MTDLNKAVALLHRWRKLYADFGCPDQADGRLFTETGQFITGIALEPDEPFDPDWFQRGGHDTERHG